MYTSYKTLRLLHSHFQREFPMIDGVLDETELSMLNLTVEQCIASFPV